MTKALVIGYGSIGQRHCTILEDMGLTVGVVSRSKCSKYKTYSSLHEAIDSFSPNYVVIANETSAHFNTLQSLNHTSFSGKVLVEKPLFDQKYYFSPQSNLQVFVAYNLRFHPLVQKLRHRLADERVVAAQVYCGQHLPDWRPQRDYRASYSSDRSQGGGVLRDLSHELDYILWLFGDWVRVSALGGHLSMLEISSDDCWSITMQTQKCRSLNLQLNYLDRPGQRTIVVNTENNTFSVDLKSGTFEQNSRHDTQISMDRSETYRAQHNAILTGKLDNLCNIDQAMNVLGLIQAIEQANDTQQWIKA